MDVESADWPSQDVLSIVLADGKDSRLHGLTHDDAKPGLPVGARPIDFTLANVANSGIRNAMVLTQHASGSLRRHIDRCWNGAEAASDSCVFSVLDGADHGPFNGTADAVASIITQIDRKAPRHVVILAGDHLYQMDYRPFLDRHLACDAEVTVGVVHVPLAQASGFGILKAQADYRITAFVENPRIAPEALDRPGHALASMGIYVFAWPVLRRMLRDMAGTVSEMDFGKHIIPALVAAGTAFTYALPGRQGQAPLWQHLGTLDAYHGVQRQFAEGTLTLDPSWPIDCPGDAAQADCGVTGLGASLRNVVLLPGARIGRSATLGDAIVTADAVIPDGFDLDATIARHGDWCSTSRQGIGVISAKPQQALAVRHSERTILVAPAIAIAR